MKTKLKIVIYSTFSYLDATIPLVNELCKTNEILLVIEYHGEKYASIWERQHFQLKGRLLTNQADVYKFVGQKLMAVIDRRIKIAVLYFPSIRILSPSRLISTFLLIKYLRKERPDVIDIHGLHGVLAMPFLSPRKMVLTLHDPFLHSGESGGFGYLLHKKIGIRYADCIIVHDKKSPGILAKAHNLANNKIAPIYLGIYTSYRHWINPTIKEEAHTILFFGRISPYKGVEYLLKAEPQISAEIPDLKIIIAGPGNFSIYEHIIKDRKRYEIYNQYIPNEFAVELFQRASCVVLPYINATQSGVLMTAYALNKPVVVTNVGGLPEVVDDGITGFIVPPKDEESLARAIIRLLKNNKLRRKMKENIRKKSVHELSWAQIASRALAVYRNTLCQ